MKEKRAPSPFRLWVHNLWVENVEEHGVFKEKPMSQQEYWDAYKHWIRKLYRDQNKQES